MVMSRIQLGRTQTTISCFVCASSSGPRHTSVLSHLIFLGIRPWVGYKAIAIRHVDAGK